MPDELQLSANDKAFADLLGRVPVAVRDSFTPAQCEALSGALAHPKAAHLVDYRLSVRWLRQRYYARLMIGHERRSLSRLLREKQISLGPTLLLVAGGIWLTVSTLLVAVFLLLYLAKTAYGFDLFDGESFLHACLIK